MRVLVCVALLGCGRLGFDVRALAGDGGATDASDAARFDVLPACTSFGPWGPPTPLDDSVQSPYDDWFPTPSRNDLTLFWYRCGPTQCDVYEAERSMPSGAYGFLSMPVPVAMGIQTVTPTATPDALDLVLAWDPGGPFQIAETSRTSAGLMFSVPSTIPELASGGIDRDPFMTSDGLHLVFESDRNGAPHIWETSRPSLASSWSTPVERTDIELPGNGEVSPTLSSDALEIFYSALVSGSTTGFDVYHATRTATDQPFSPPALVPELQTAGDEVGNRLSQDGATLWLNSNSYTAGGMNAIMYVTTRGCL